jgi:Spy/CpxP family protein refolding chaperone
MGVPWKVVGAAVVIFGAGVISGSVATRLYQNYTKPPLPVRPPGGPPPPWVGQRMDFLRHMEEALGLTAAQRNRIDQLIKESQQRTRELWEGFSPKLKAEMERLKAAVDAELTPEQRAKAEELHKQRMNRPRGERPPGRWPEGQGPRRWGPGMPGEGGPPGEGRPPLGPPPQNFPPPPPESAPDQPGKAPPPSTPPPPKSL